MTAPSVKFKHLRRHGQPLTPAQAAEQNSYEKHIQEIWAEQQALMPPTVIGMGLGLPLAPRYRRTESTRLGRH
jgi:hypothetical protein